MCSLAIMDHFLTVECFVSEEPAVFQAKAFASAPLSLSELASGFKDLWLSSSDPPSLSRDLLAPGSCNNLNMKFYNYV